MPYTLITGASHGIGKAMAEECGKRGLDMALVALPGEELEAVGKSVAETYGVKVKCFGVDLTQADSPKKVFDWAQQEGLDINNLINNAGMGVSGMLENVPVEKYQYIMQLNNQAMVGITYYFLPNLKKHAGNAAILFMSAMGGTLPLPYQAVYSSTKAFILNFAMAMRAELKADGVSVTVVCPGPVITNEGGMKRIKSHGNRGKLMIKMPDEVAILSIDKMFKGKLEVIPGFLPWFIVKVMRYIPYPLKIRITEKLFRVYRTHDG